MKKSPLRVLHVVATLGRGGAETMIMNHYHKIDRTKIQFDFLVNYKKRAAFDDEVEALGGHIYRSLPIRPWSYHKYFKFLDNFFSEHSDYIAVHSHIQDNSGFVLKYAAKHGIKFRIAHSHLANYAITYKYPFLLYARHYLKKYVNIRFACGNAAGNYMFGQKYDFIVLKNAIDTNNFTYNERVRRIKRQELGLSDEQFVVGNVARFYPQKNHRFILMIFLEIVRREPDAVLILCGTGNLLKKMKSLAKDLGIDANVKFLGSRNDIPELLQAFDVILMPSLFEGLPVSVIEAQSAALPCVLSDRIDPETAITDLVSFHSLKMSASEWAQTVIEKRFCQRYDTSQMLKKSGYDVNENAKWLTNFYLSLYRQTDSPKI